MEDLAGKKLGQYEIKEKVGQGGMAQVYKAYHATLARYVAVKVLSPALAERPDFSERFQREAQAVARLNHPNILQVFDSGIEGQYNFIVMRYVENSTTLDNLIKAGARIDQLIQYVIQVADALNYAHKQGIIHRDIKPGNILIDGEWALLADFGLVKMAESSSELTSTGLTMGTPAYMSPEQSTGRPVDRRTDIYALGIILYKILTGAVPHHAPTPLAIAIKRSSEPIPPLRNYNPDISPEFEAIILKALEINPENRYNTAAEFAAALRRVNIDSDATMVNPVLNTQIPSSQTGDMTMASGVASATPTVVPTETQSNNTMLKVGGAIAAILIIGLLAAIFFIETSDHAEVPTAVIETPVVVAPTATPEVATATHEPPPSPTAPPPTVPKGEPEAIALALVDIYTGPDSEIYSIMGALPEGASTKITARNRDGDWWQIDTPNGKGWIPADETLVEARNTENLLIAQPPETPTPTVTPTATDTPTPEATETPTATATSEFVATAPPTAPPAPPTPSIPEGTFRLVSPNLAVKDETSTGITDFEWQWNGPVAENQGFEVRIWRDGEPPRGVHDAVLDNRQGRIKKQGATTYRLKTDISKVGGLDTPTGVYNWTVLLIEYEPAYKELGIQADPVQLRYAAPGPAGGGGPGGGAGGPGGGPGGGD